MGGGGEGDAEQRGGAAWVAGGEGGEAEAAAKGKPLSRMCHRPRGSAGESSRGRAGTRQTTRGNPHARRCPQRKGQTTCSKRAVRQTVCRVISLNCCADCHKNQCHQQHQCLSVRKMGGPSGIWMCPSPKGRGQTKFYFGPLNVGCLYALAPRGPTHTAESRTCERTNERHSPPAGDSQSIRGGGYFARSWRLRAKLDALIKNCQRWRKYGTVCIFTILSKKQQTITKKKGIKRKPVSCASSAPQTSYCLRGFFFSFSMTNTPPLNRH